jgi:hypothetical protein
MVPKALAASIDIFIAHYDGGREWYARNTAWHANVTYSHVNYPGWKASFVLNELVLPHHQHRLSRGSAASAGSARTPGTRAGATGTDTADATTGSSILSKYSHVWVTDADIQWPSLADVNIFLNVIKVGRIGMVGMVGLVRMLRVVGTSGVRSFLPSFLNRPVIPRFVTACISLRAGEAATHCSTYGPRLIHAPRSVSRVRR